MRSDTVQVKVQFKITTHVMCIANASLYGSSRAVHTHMHTSLNMTTYFLVKQVIVASVQTTRVRL